MIEHISVPIIPDYLCTLDGNSTTNSENDENGRVGLLLSSKALVQLILNPAVGIFTGTLGYTKPLFLGNLSLLLAAMRKLISILQPLKLFANSASSDLQNHQLWRKIDFIDDNLQN